MKKRLISALLASSLVLSMMAGCTQNEQTPSSSGDDTSTSGSSQPSEPTNAVAPSGEFPIVSEPIQLNIMAAQQAQISDLEDNDFTKMLEEKTNIEIVWNTVPQASASEKLNVTLTTGANMPEVIIGFDINMSQQIALGESQGMFVDMMPYLDTYGQNIQQVFEDIPVLELIAKNPSGKLLGMVGAEETYHVKYPQKAWTNAAFLEAVDMEIPTTTDEFKELLIAYRDEDPNGNGQNDEIPLTGAITGWNTFIVPYIMSAFVEYMQPTGVTGTTDKSVTKMALGVEDGMIVPSFTTDGWKEGLKYLNDLVEEDLLDPLAFTQDQNQLKNAVAAEPRIVGVATGGSTGAISPSREIQEEYMVALPPLEGPNGFASTYYSPISSSSGRYVITSECQNIEAAVRLVDYFVSEEGSLSSLYGIEGRDWVYVDDPTVLGLNGEPAVFDNILEFGQQTSAHWAKMAPQIMPDSLRNGMAYDAAEGFDPEVNLYNETKSKYEPVSNGKYLLPLTLKEDLVTEYVDLFTPLAGYLDQMTSAFITGTSDIDAEWDNYVSTLDAMGLDRFMEVLNESYTYAYGEDALSNF